MFHVEHFSLAAADEKRSPYFLERKRQDGLEQEGLQQNVPRGTFI